MIHVRPLSVVCPVLRRTRDARPRDCAGTGWDLRVGVLYYTILHMHARTHPRNLWAVMGMDVGFDVGASSP